MMGDIVLGLPPVDVSAECQGGGNRIMVPSERLESSERRGREDVRSRVDMRQRRMRQEVAGRCLFWRINSHPGSANGSGLTGEDTALRLYDEPYP